MKKIIVFYGVFFLVSAAECQPLFIEKKPELVNLLRTADQQRELIGALLEDKTIENVVISVDELNVTIKKLEQYREFFIAEKTKMGKLSDQESRCLSLVQELIRQLTNARLAYEQKIKNNASVRKIAISAGAAVTVFGGLMVLKAATGCDISISAALACGIAAGCVTGAITYYAKN